MSSEPSTGGAVPVGGERMGRNACMWQQDASLFFHFVLILGYIMYKTAITYYRMPFI